MHSPRLNPYSQVRLIAFVVAVSRSLAVSLTSNAHVMLVTYVIAVLRSDAV